MLNQHPAHLHNRPSPAIVAQDAVWRLPRWLLWALCTIYICTGFIWRDPWKSADAIALGFMQALAEGRSSWLQPTLLDHTAPAFTWLPYYLGAISIKLSPAFIPLDMAARIPFALLLLGTLMAVWYATYLLARAPDAQPLPFALGGEAKPVDYGRTVADGSLLAIMATLGLAQLGHEATPTLARLFFVALWLYGVAAQELRPRKAIWATSCASIGLAFSGGPLLALLLAGLLSITNRLQAPAQVHSEQEAQLKSARQKQILIIALVACCTSIGLQALQSGSLSLVVSNWWLSVQMRPAGSLGRLVAWFLWPTALMAVVALFVWRRWWRSPHILVPASIAALTSLQIFFNWQSDRALLLATPALAVLAAMYLPAMRRTISSWIDWFALLFFSGCAFLMWGVWFSLETGWPAQPARNVERLLPGFAYESNWWGFAAAVLASIAWLRLIHWRVGRDRSALWKSLALPAGGAALCWLLLMSLWFPMLNYARGYSSMMQLVKGYVAQAPKVSGGQADCAYVHKISPEQTAALYFHQPLPIYAYQAPYPHQCRWFLVSRENIGSMPDLVGEQLWELQATIQRPSDQDEYLMLYKRAAP